jgi:hypothetical protein
MSELRRWVLDASAALHVVMRLPTAEPVIARLEQANLRNLCLNRHCEEQSNEAICNSLIHWLRDCFASLAMTGYMN